MRHRAGPPQNDPYSAMNVGYGMGGGAPAYGSSSASYDTAVFKDKPRKRGSFVLPSFLSSPWIGFLASVFFAALALNFRSQQQGLLKALQVTSAKQGRELLDKLQNEKKTLDLEVRKARASEKQATFRIQTLEKQQKTLEQERDNLKNAQVASASSSTNSSVNLVRENEFKSLVQRLQLAVQKSSKEAVLEK